MKALLFALVLVVAGLAVPGAAADDDPVCGGATAAKCVLDLLADINDGCPPLHDNVQECDRDEDA